jgi:predicted AAA+ superfamily ATPase
MLYHPRSALAVVLADALQGKTLFSDAPNGLFLAAPRRTGKSTFLQADLMPELGRRQIVGVYVDDYWTYCEDDASYDAFFKKLSAR